jgi:hypothetical protein
VNSDIGASQEKPVQCLPIDPTPFLHLHIELSWEPLPRQHSHARVNTFLLHAIILRLLCERKHHIFPPLTRLDTNRDRFL